VLERLTVTRVVTTPEALDAATMPTGVIVLRTAPDEALVLGTGDFVVDDPHAIVVADAGWSGVWLDSADAGEFLSHHCAWPRPATRPAFAQGMVAHMPVKLWLEEHRTLFVIPHVSAVDFGELLEGAR
jgi:hypothetical protein